MWSPDSWRSKTIAQDVFYDDKEHLDRVLGKLRRLPPLVSPVEVDRLRNQLADVAQGKAFLLQGGDCAELFDDCSSDPIEHKLSLVLLMSLIILHGSRLPVVRVMRIAGQYAKPRSKPTEMVNGKEVLSFRGDNVNGYSVDDRKPDPERLLGAYFHSTATLNYIRTLLGSGFADLHKPLDWSFSHVRSAETAAAFQGVIDSLSDSLEFMRVATGGDRGGRVRGGTETVEVYTSHEALLLEYEEALTRQKLGEANFTATPSSSRPTSPTPSRSASSDRAAREKYSHYNLSSHFIWIGDRTRQLDGAHVEYFRGIANPIGIKVGPTMDPAELVRILDIVNPDRLAGKVTVIGRYGAGKVEQFLPAHIDAVKATDHVVVWQCDAMHGNTKSAVTDPTLKTRHFADIVKEIVCSLEIHRSKGTILGGVHLELTGEVRDGYSVTECIGGSMELEDKDLSTNYRTHCDPRLNYEQSLDVAFLLADHLKARRKGGKPHILSL